jgi:hypothetical protein
MLIFLKKLKMELPYDPAISFLGIYPNKDKLGDNSDTCTSMFLIAQQTYLAYSQ